MGSLELARLWNITHKGSRLRKIPDRDIENFRSAKIGKFSSDNWVVGRFSSHTDEMVYLGGNSGTIGVLRFHGEWNPEASEALRPAVHCFSAHRGVVMDLADLSCSSTKAPLLLSASGDTTIRLWDIEKMQESSTFLGHERTVRSLSTNKDDPWMFISCSRDGTIQRWDRRCASARDVFINPHSFETTTKTLTPKNNRSRRPRTVEQSSITSVLFTSQHQFVSGSEKANTGARLWDLRFMKKTAGFYMPLKKFNINTTANKGIACLAVDRFGSSLFAAVTDRNVYEFSLLSGVVDPINIYSGAHINPMFDVAQMSISPVSDHLICGSRDGRAVIWDLQETHCYIDDRPSIKDISSICNAQAIQPKWETNGHQDQVIAVGWSCKGNYLLTMDEEYFRIWDKKDPGREKADQSFLLPIGMERVQRLRVTKPKPRLRSSLDRPPTTECLNSPTKDLLMRGAKRAALAALQSPRKSNSSTGNNALSPRTPRAKRNRIEQVSPVLPPLIASPSPGKRLPPLIESLKTPVKTPNKTPKKRPPLRPKNVFHAEYPTWKLPNIRYENHIKKLRAREISCTGEITSPGLINSPRSMDDWLRRPARSGHPSRLIRLQVPVEQDFMEASCSKMLTEEERMEAKSPLKKVIRTPIKANPGLSSSKEHNDTLLHAVTSPASAINTPKPTQRRLKFSDENTPKLSTTASKNCKTPLSSSRNILHYFPRTPK